MAKWDAQKFTEGFHTPEGERVTTINRSDKFDLVMLGKPFELSSERWKVVARVHGEIAKEWVNGGCVALFYKFDFLGRMPVGEPPDRIEAPHLISSLWRIGQDQDFPKEIAGCSIAYLAEGRVWGETIQKFGDAIYMALSQGGAYSKEKLDNGDAKKLTASYIEALFGESAESSLYFFGLDIGFSCWFFGVYWDFAYAVVNVHEHWLALILATDTD